MASNGDAVEYLALARQWLEHGTFQNLTGLPQPEIFRMPGYPLFIVFFYKIIPNVALAVLVQNVIFVVGIALFYKFVLSLFQNQRIALISAGFLAFEPSVAYWNNQLITETLFAVMVFLSLYSSFIFCQNKKLYYPALSGLCLSLAIFIRPAGEYLAVIFIIFYLLLLLKKVSFKKIILAVLIFIIAFLTPLSPWMIRNKKVFGSYAVSNSSNIGFGKYWTAINEQLNEDTVIYFAGIENPLKKASAVRQKTISLVVAHPMIFFKIYTLSLVPFFFGDAYLSVFGRIFPELEKQRVVTDWEGGSELFGFIYGHKGAEAFVFFLGKLAWSLVTLFAVAGIFCWMFKYKKEYPIFIFVLLLILYFSLASGVGSYSRFRFPVVAYIFLFSSIGIHWLLGMWTPKVSDNSDKSI